jgi:hypothetical protein
MITKDFHSTKDFPRIRGKSFVIMEIHPPKPETVRAIARYAQYAKGSSASPAT